MDIQAIKHAALQVYIDCHIDAFPFSCSCLLQHYNFKVYSYSQLRMMNAEVYEICKKFSKDAFTYNTIICYNDSMPKERIRFSLMHELGHFLLNTENELLANHFASHILAPRSVIYKCQLKNANEVARFFLISKESASYAYKDTQTITTDSQLTAADTSTIKHFYNTKEHIHVFHICECPICGSNIYNSLKNTCIQCKKLSIKSK